MRMEINGEALALFVFVTVCVTITLITAIVTEPRSAHQDYEQCLKFNVLTDKQCDKVYGYNK